MSDDRQILINSITAGVILGVLMSILFLKMMIAADFAMNVKMIPAAVIAACLPFCLRFLTRLPLRGTAVLFTMCIVSFTIILLYAHTVAGALEARTEYMPFFLAVTGRSLLLHGCTAAGGIAALRLGKQKEKR